MKKPSLRHTHSFQVSNDLHAKLMAYTKKRKGADPKWKVSNSLRFLVEKALT